MVRSMEITKVSVRNRLVVDAEVRMNDPKDYDFSPRVDIEGNTLSLRNKGDEEATTTAELDTEQLNTAERDRMLELRVKFAVEGMHGVLTHKTKNTRIAPNAKKLAEPRWKTVLPLSM